jgi:hypothetical protein
VARPVAPARRTAVTYLALRTWVPDIIARNGGISQPPTLIMGRQSAGIVAVLSVAHRSATLSSFTHLSLPIQPDSRRACHDYSGWRCLQQPPPS